MREASMRRPGGRLFLAVGRVLGSSAASLRSAREDSVVGGEEQRVRAGQGPDRTL